MTTKMEKLKTDGYAIKSDESIIDQMKTYVHNSSAIMKYCKQLGMTDDVINDNIIKIYEFGRDLSCCRKCPGLKSCKKENAYLNSKITYSNGVVETQLIPCPELLKRVSFERQFKVRDFPDEWLDARVGDYDYKIRVDSEKNKNNPVKKALNNLTLYEIGKEMHWAYLYGANRTGKSYLAAVMAIDLANKGNKGQVPVCYINASKRFRELSELDKLKSNEFKEKLELYSNVPVLVIDDFGNEFKNDFIRDAIVKEIITTRCSKKLYTIFTSNYTLDEIGILYSGSNSNPAAAIMAGQIVRTIKAMCGKDKEISFGDLPLF